MAKSSHVQYRPLSMCNVILMQEGAQGGHMQVASITTCIPHGFLPNMERHQGSKLAVVR